MTPTIVPSPGKGGARPRWLLCAGLACLLAPAARAQSPWYFGGQANYIYQAHGTFPAAFSGPNSLRPAPEDALSRVLTFYSGVRLTGSTEVLVDLEETGGQGLSQVLGLAGFPNLDAVRNPELGTAPYLARLLVDHVIALGGPAEPAAKSFLNTFTQLPRRRLVLRVGKFSLPDFFDVNAAGGDSHQQFINWTVDNNGAYDYAADTRGYTWGAMAEYDSPAWDVRFAEALMPRVANGIQFQTNLSRAHAENLEFEWHAAPSTTVRLLGYQNTANMGVYRDAVQRFLDGLSPRPDITDHPAHAVTKRGAGLNLEQHFGPSLTAFGRLGAADGRYESFAYTEVEQTAQGGFTLDGRAWQRGEDKLGAAYAVNGISGDHRRYLALGGLGFLLGDGGLVYGHERILETFYTVHIAGGFSIAPDWQYIVNPGYDRARGPVSVAGARLHAEF